MRFSSLAPVVALLAMSVAAPASAQMAQVAGDWEFEFESPRGAQTITLTFVQDGATLGGEAKMMMQDREMQMDIEGKVEAMKVEFSFAFAPPAGGGGRGGAGGGAGGAGRGGAGGGAGGARGPGGGFAFAGDLIDGELRGKLTTGRGDPVDVVLKRPATR